MKRHSFFTKLFVGNLLLIVVAITFVGGTTYHFLNVDYQRDSEARQRQLTELARAYFETSWPQSPEVIDRECKRLFGDQTMRLTVIARDGHVLGDSDWNPASMENHKTDDRPEVLAALQGRQGHHVRMSQTLQILFRYNAAPIFHDGRIVATARTAMPVRTIAEGSSFIRNTVLGSALSAVAVAILLAILLSWIWYKPLRRIMLAARRIASGNLNARVRVSGSDELAQLGDALNEMRKNLDVQFHQINIQRENLRTVLANVGEGIIALDGEGYVVFFNPPAAKLFNMTEPASMGKRFQDIIRSADAVACYERAVQTAQPARKQLDIDITGTPRILDFLVIPVANPTDGGIATVVVARDITDMARTAAMKTEFVANASHELRTPLATIRAAVDSLESIGPTDKTAFEKFLGILDRHTRRLENMANDLLDLRLIESVDRADNYDLIDVSIPVRWIHEQFAERAEKKGVALTVEPSKRGMQFTSDRVLVRLIVQNLLDNALKFTPAGGRITCCFERQGENVVLTVADTGCGIPAELQDRVFERFFQVETSRTNNGGVEKRGTGLGLAIVKHAAERLGATISLCSELGKGTTVAVAFPVSGTAN